jgi:hypothetical protein
VSLPIVFVLPGSGAKAATARPGDPQQVVTANGAAGADDPEQTATATATPWPTGWPTPRPTWTPWWTPPVSTCVPGVNCGTPRPTRTPCNTCTPPPAPTVSGTVTQPARQTLRLRPLVQFGRPDSDGAAHYNQWLLNHFLDDTTVDVNGVSVGHWPLVVRPEHTVVHPDIPSTISITVGVPPSHALPIDIEHTVVFGGSPSHPVTATAHLITIAMRHPFTDVPMDYWADGPIQYLVAQGIISGYADGSLHPDGYVTRAQLAKMLVGIMGWEIQLPASPTFTDVGPNFWAYGYIETAAAHGAISGYSDGTFRPTAGVTRAQIAKVVATAQAWSPDDISSGSSFTDVSTDDWLYDYAQMASAAEVMSGYSDGTFRPYTYATRAQIAKVLALSIYTDPNN